MLLRNGGKRGSVRSFFFFESLVNIFFSAILGIFANILLVFLPLSLIHMNPLHPQISLFSSVGIVFFLFSRRMFLDKYRHQLKRLNYDSFLVSRNKLFFWILWTFNFYLIFCWILLIFLGTTRGLWINYSGGTQEPALLYADPGSTKLVGLILLMVHVFTLILVKVIVHHWARIFAFAHGEFEKRRKNLAIVRNKASLEG